MSKVTPLDLLNPNAHRVTEDVAAERLSVCESCPDLIGGVKVCKHCGCFMKLKTTLAEATCPLGKW